MKKKTSVKKTPARAKPAPKAKAKAGPAKPSSSKAAKPLVLPARQLPAVGAPLQGGFYAGKFFGADGAPYALIVAPKKEGEAPAELAFKTARTSDAGARSLRDGMANSAAMANANHPAAAFCRDLKIGGFKDWYLPSRHEAALLAENLMPGKDYVPEQTTAEAFKEGGPEAFSRTWYWTSTELNAGYAWVQYFYDGLQNNLYKDWECRVRAVRKCPL